MTDWTPENRLRLIWEMAAIEFNGGGPGSQTKDLMQRIMFLCDMPDKFLEINKANYQDAIDRTKRGSTRVEL